MLKVRIIPTLLTDGFGLVKGEAFESWRTVGSLMPAIRVYNRRDVDELLILDVAARREGRSCDPSLIEDAAAEVRVPLTIGGGLSNLGDIATALHAGADKVVLNTAALDRPELIDEASSEFGSQAIVVAIDATIIQNEMRCLAQSGQRPTSRTPQAWAVEAESRGAGELIVTRADYDGLLTGYDLDLIASVCRNVELPVVASGGAGNYDHMRDAVIMAGASAVAAGAMFQFTQQTPDLARAALGANGIPVRASLNERAAR